MCFPCFALVSFACFGQSENENKIRLFLQAGPILSFNSYSTTGEGSEFVKMKNPNLAFGTGLELNIPVSNKLTLTPILKWQQQKQKIYQDELHRFFQEGSYIYKEWGFWNMNFGAMLEYQLNKNDFSPTNFVFGTSFSHIYQTENSGGSHLIFNPYYPSEVYFEYGSQHLGNDFSLKSNYFNIILGARKEVKVSKLGSFKFGFLAFVPLGKMPTYNFQSTLTSDKETFIVDSYTSSRKMNVEISILYRLFSFKLDPRR